MKFPTHAVLGTSTGRLLGDIGGIYSVISFLIGRDAYTHDLAFYGRRAEAAIKAVRPDLPGPDDAEHVTKDNYKNCLAAWEKQFGNEIDLPDSLRDCLADDKNTIETLSEIIDPSKIVVVNVGRDNL
jgi:hypothetical protein